MSIVHSDAAGRRSAGKIRSGHAPFFERLVRGGGVFGAAVLATASVAAQSPLGLPTAPLPTPTHVAVFFDLDGDGDQDGIETSGTTAYGGGPSRAILLNDGFGRFTRRETTGLPAAANVGDHRWCVADFNGDGSADFLYGGSSSGGGVLIGLYFGSPNFAYVAGPMPPFTSGVAGTPTIYGLAAGDVDGDGDADLLVGRTAPNSNAPGLPALLLNNGLGTFTPAAATALPSIFAPYLVTRLLDLDDDGDLDASLFGTVLGFSAPHTVLFNDGTGVFSAAGFPPALNTATSVPPTFGDFDGDGRQDFADWTVVPPGVLALGLARGIPGGFAAPVTTSFAQPGVRRLAFDVDGDGDDELLVQEWCAEGGCLVAYGVNADFTLGAAVVSAPSSVGDPAPVAVDLDGDGDQDVATRDSALLWNDSAGALVFSGDPGRPNPTLLATDGTAGDVDGNGFTDVVGRRLAIAFGDGAGGFTLAPEPALPPPFDAVGADFRKVLLDRDGDGDLDLYAVAYSGAASSDFVFDNDGTGAFTVAFSAPSSGPMTFSNQLLALDVDLDGDLDVVRGNGGSAVGTFAPPLLIENLGAAGFAAAVPIGANGVNTRDLLAADFDGDGDVDLLQLALLSGQSMLYTAQGGAFTTTPVAGIFGTFAAAGDLDLDGDADLVLENAVRWSQNGAFTLGSVLPSALQNTPRLVDLDGDGDLDLFEHPGTVIMNLGGGVFGAPISVLKRTPAAQSHFRPRPFAVDADRDGDLDVINGDGRLLTNLTRQLAHAGPPRLAIPNDVRLYAPPATPWLLFAAAQSASLPLPPYGLVQLDPATAILVAEGTTPSAGPGVGSYVPTPLVSITLPANPALVGFTWHWQAIDAATLTFGNRLTSVVLGY
jgi:hypothetical protein